MLLLLKLQLETLLHREIRVEGDRLEDCFSATSVSCVLGFVSSVV